MSGWCNMRSRSLATACLAWLLLHAASATRADGIRVSGIQMTPAGPVIAIACPSGFTNRLDILGIADLAPAGWTVLATGLVFGAGSSSLAWTDPAAASARVRFYLVGNHDRDSDADGLPDAVETRVHRTRPDSPDTDGDGVGDGLEVARGTNPADPASRAAVLYVDTDSGDDACDGLAERPAGLHGPKRSLGAAAALAVSGDTLQVRGDAPCLEPGLRLGGHSVRLRPAGAVVLRP